MASPSVWTPIAVDPVTLTPTLATLYTAGASGAILDSILLANSGVKDVAKMWDYDLSVTTYNDRTAAANNAVTADVVMGRTDIKTQPDYLYFSSASLFTSLMFIISTRLVGATCTIEVAYGSTAGNPGTYTVMTAATNGLVDGTLVFTQIGGGEISWSDPTTWAIPWVTTTPGAATAGYFIRIGILTADPTTIMIGSQCRIGTNGGVPTTVYYVPNGGTAGDGNVLAPAITVPRGVPVNVLRDLVGRPFHMEPSSTIQAQALNPQVTVHVGGVDYS